MQDTKKNNGKFHWMNSKLKFHIDAENAFNLQDALQGVQSFGGVGQVNENINTTQIQTKTIVDDNPCPPQTNEEIEMEMKASADPVGNQKRQEVDQILKDVIG